jgi:cytochrome c553
MKFVTTLTAVVLVAAMGRATAGQGTEATAPVAPRFLSGTGLYADAATLKIDARNRLFSPQYPLWSDGATKRRWVQLPAGSTINVADLAKWELPVGTKFWKEFSFKGRKVETRFLWQTGKDQWIFASYAWNEAQTEAELASETGIANITEVEGGKRHSIPSVGECRACHDSQRTETLGFDALQLSTDRDPNALHAEALTPEMLTLRTLVDEDLISPKRADLVTNPPRIAAASPVTRTALGYLSTNCGNCHNRDSSIASLGLDLKHTVDEPKHAGNEPKGSSLQDSHSRRDSRRDEPLGSSINECTAAIATTVGQRGHWVVPEAEAESRIINPGHPESSALIRRVKSRRPLSQMPPIGTVAIDRQAVDLLTAWVEGNAAEWQRLMAQCATQSH